MIADMINNENLTSTVTELFIRGRKLSISIVFITQSYFKRKLSISIVFITQSYFKGPKDVKLNYLL